MPEQFKVGDLITPILDKKRDRGWSISVANHVIYEVTAPTDRNGIVKFMIRDWERDKGLDDSYWASERACCHPWARLAEYFTHYPRIIRGKNKNMFTPV